MVDDRLKGVMMASSWNIFSKKWWRWEPGLFPKRWEESILRGWQVVREGKGLVVDRSIAEGERLRLLYRLDRTDRKLHEAYRLLAKRVLDQWAGKGRLSEEERKREFSRIGLLIEEQKKLQQEISELEASPQSDDQKSEPMRRQT
ncbi:MAG: hypothetical protein WAO55_09025 [Candidatus Manganitrophaceae bacterium]